MTRLRALIVTPRLPWPLDDGGRIGLWQAVSSVAPAYETMLVSLVPEAEAELPLPEVFTSIGVEVIRIPHRPPWTPVAAVRGAFGRWPYMLTRYRNQLLDRTLRRIVADQRPAFAYVHHLHLATYLDALAGVPVILREHNLEHLWLERYARTVSNPLVRLYALDQARRTRRTEAALCAGCDLVLAIRDAEAEVLRRLAPSTRVAVLPIGIQMDPYLARAPERPPVTILAGSWDWPPNREGGQRFVEEGWARVRARLPEARLRVVGKAMPAALSEAALRAGAEPVGYVEDIYSEFARASVMVVPLWMGTGARVKIVEALAARLPVVTTTLGAEGLGLTPGTHALFADTPDSLGEAVADLLLQPARAHALAEAGYAFAAERFSLRVVSRLTQALCGSVVARPAADVA